MYKQEQIELFKQLVEHAKRIAEMELAGICLDQEYANRLSAKYAKKLEEIDPRYGSSGSLTVLLILRNNDDRPVDPLSKLSCNNSNNSLMCIVKLNYREVSELKLS